MSVRVRAVILAAQSEEVRPILSCLEKVASRPAKLPHTPFPAWFCASTRGNLIVVQTGIGLVCAASATMWALDQYSPRLVTYAGTTGGLARDIKPGDVVVGTSFAYSDADATAFGYKRGQVPGQPAVFESPTNLVERLEGDYRKGLMLSGNSFVTAANVGDTREAFPDALSVDMETTAAAHVCAMQNVPFMAVRCVSDLCGPEAHEDYSLALDEAAAKSADALVTLVESVASHVHHGQTQRFSKNVLSAGLLLMLARVRKLEPLTDYSLSEELKQEILTHVGSENSEYLPHIFGSIAAAEKMIREDPSTTLTAKQYDAERAAMGEQFGFDSGRGKLAWPPTSQTIIKRFNGYWNDALAHVGIRPLSGRKRGGLKFSNTDCLHALRAFARWTARNGVQPSYKAYQDWAAREDHLGKVPSGAAIRQRYGSWREATRAAQI